MEFNAFNFRGRRWHVPPREWSWGLLKDENTILLAKFYGTPQYNAIYYNNAKQNILIIRTELAGSKLSNEHRKEKSKMLYSSIDEAPVLFSH